MLMRIKRLPTPALVIAVIALALALSGGSYALGITSAKVKVIAKRVAVKQIAQRIPGAEISAGATPSVLSGRGVTGVTWEGSYYIVTFKKNISQCVPLGSTTGTNGNNTDSRINVVHRSSGPKMLNVRTYEGATENSVNTLNFSVAVLC
ncbi:MAG: hypothetical protein OEV60_13585 [Actinomycetota bacterium]|nr:hypothetical protein [Actinomycetota bacterium]MDH5225414.1 hypothetical protein [Actinomycetota bacterium]MDH5313223.1 hypothetical protein [Actinomycetota bacterium]